MADVFISYSKARAVEAAELARELADLGFEVWWDTSLLPTGSFGAAIDRELDAATAVIVMWSPEAARSKWVRSEASHADRQDKLVNCHTAEITHPAAQIPKPFEQTHSVPADDIRALLRALDALSVPRSGKSAANMRPPAPEATAAEMDDRLFAEVAAEATAEAYQFYLDELPQGRSAAIARFRLRGLVAVPPASPPLPAVPPTSAAAASAAASLRPVTVVPSTSGTSGSAASAAAGAAAAPVVGDTSPRTAPSAVVPARAGTSAPPATVIPPQAGTQTRSGPGGEGAAALDRDWAPGPPNTGLPGVGRQGARGDAGDGAEPAQATRLGSVEATTPRTAAAGPAAAGPSAVADRPELVRYKVRVGSGVDDRIVEMAPGECIKDLAFAPEMVLIPPGKYLQGDERLPVDGVNRREVTIGYPLLVGKYPVTFDEWDSLHMLYDLKHFPKDEGWGRGRRPVINVSWHDATEYAARLSKLTGKAYRLLSEAEWEYACRAGTTTAYSFGNTISPQQSSFSSSNTIEVGQFSANLFGLFDMHGMVDEWCDDDWDWKHEYLRPTSAGEPEFSIRTQYGRVQRGGSFASSSSYLRSAKRDGSDPEVRSCQCGFRVARTV